MILFDNDALVDYGTSELLFSNSEEDPAPSDLSLTAIKGKRGSVISSIVDAVEFVNPDQPEAVVDVLESAKPDKPEVINIKHADVGNSDDDIVTMSYLVELRRWSDRGSDEENDDIMKECQLPTIQVRT